jgi:hypothetical protein
MRRNQVSVIAIALVGLANGCGLPPQPGEVAEANVNGDTACDQNGCISVSAFAQGIANALAGQVEGYEVKVGASAALGGGFAQSKRDASPNGIAMSSSVPANIASVSKVITTIAALQTLARHQISIDSKIAPYLWPDWQVDPSLQELTFRQLLTHKSGLRDSVTTNCPGNPPSNCNATPPGGQFINCGGNNTTYQVLQQELKNGVAAGAQNTAAYSNCNFAMFRELLPRIEQTYSGDNSVADRAQWSAGWYESIVNKNVFERVGVGPRSCNEPSGDVLGYPSATPGSTPGVTWGDWTLACGGGGWYLSVDDLYKVFNDVANGGLLLSPDEKSEMSTGSMLGWDNTVNAPCAEGGPCKNGSLNDPAAPIWDYVGIVKCNLPVIAVVNSPLPGGFEKNGNIIGLIRNVYGNLKPVSGPALCCDGSQPCGRSKACCAQGQACNASGSCQHCGGPGEPCCPSSFERCDNGLTCGANNVCSCGATGTGCSASSQCCSADCASGVCQCSAVGHVCHANSECCSKTCTRSTCACIPQGSACGGGVVCCGTNVCTNGICAQPTGPSTCNGQKKPTRGCSAGWVCCGDDGWECGRCI